jgi:hypothetical protein
MHTRVTLSADGSRCLVFGWRLLPCPAPAND